MLNIFLDGMHLLFVFTPILIYLSKRYKKYSKFLLLLVMIVPMHWELFDRQCILTVLSKKLGNFSETTTNSAFSEVYLKWLYKPILNMVGLKWNENGIHKMAVLHAIINYILVWYYTFYY